MATLAQLRAVLNDELGVDDDTESSPWSLAVRNSAISAGYAELWRAGVWKPIIQTASTVTGQWVYALTTIRRLERLELRSSDGTVIDSPGGFIETDGAAGYQVRLIAPLGSAASLVIRGYTAYKSVFSGDSDTDDIPAEDARVPLLKAKEICYRRQLARFVRYGSRQTTPPAMNVTAAEMIGIAAAARVEFNEAAAALAGLRRKHSQPRTG